MPDRSADRTGFAQRQKLRVGGSLIASPQRGSEMPGSKIQNPPLRRRVRPVKSAKARLRKSRGQASFQVDNVQVHMWPLPEQRSFIVALDLKSDLAADGWERIGSCSSEHVPTVIKALKKVSARTR